MLWLVELLLSSEVIIDGSDWLSIRLGEGKSRVYLRTVEVDWTSQVGVRKHFLRAVAEVEADTDDRAIARARNVLDQVTTPMAVLTNNRIAIVRLISATELEFGKSVQRTVYHPDPTADVRTVALTKDSQLLAAALHLFKKGQVEPRLQRAMTWYNRGLKEADYLEGFMFSWIALELLADIHKPTSKVADKCVFCKTPLLCSSCGKTQEHRPWNSQAVKLLVTDKLGRSEELFAQLLSTRNLYFHGDEALEPPDAPFVLVKQKLNLDELVLEAVCSHMGWNAAALKGFAAGRKRRSLVLAGKLQLPSGPIPVTELFDSLDRAGGTPSVGIDGVVQEIDPNLLHLILEA